MGVLTQGTETWVKHGSPAVLTKIECITELSVGDDSVTEIETTCMEERESSTSEYGLVKPGEGSLKINTDPENETHVTILNLAQNKEKVEVFVGWADGTVAPTLQGDVVTVPKGRSWTQFQAQLRKGPPIFDKDSLVNHTIPMKRQTPAFDTLKTV